MHVYQLFDAICGKNVYPNEHLDKSRKQFNTLFRESDYEEMVRLYVEKNRTAEERNVLTQLMSEIKIPFEDKLLYWAKFEFSLHGFFYLFSLDDSETIGNTLSSLRMAYYYNDTGKRLMKYAKTYIHYLEMKSNRYMVLKGIIDYFPEQCNVEEGFFPYVLLNFPKIIEECLKYKSLLCKLPRLFEIPPFFSCRYYCDVNPKTLKSIVQCYPKSKNMNDVKMELSNIKDDCCARLYACYYVKKLNINGYLLKDDLNRENGIVILEWLRLNKITYDMLQNIDHDDDVNDKNLTLGDYIAYSVVENMISNRFDHLDRYKSFKGVSKKLLQWYALSPYIPPLDLDLVSYDARMNRSLTIITSFELFDHVPYFGDLFYILTINDGKSHQMSDLLKQYLNILGPIEIEVEDKHKYSIRMFLS